MTKVERVEKLKMMSKWVVDTFGMHPILGRYQVIIPKDSRWNPFYIIHMQSE